MLENKGVFTCSCGCGSAMTVSYIDKTAYLDFLSSDYFTKQGLLTNLKETMALAAAEAISPKPIILKEILIDRDTLIHLKKSLQSLELSNEQNHNYSKLSRHHFIPYNINWTFSVNNSFGKNSVVTR